MNVRAGRTSRKRLFIELALSGILGVITTVVVTTWHANFAVFDAQMFMTNGLPTVDDPANPQWFSVVCHFRGAVGVLSRQTAHMDMHAAQAILAASREREARHPVVPSWSQVHDPASLDPQEFRSVLEQVHGWPLPVLYRAEYVDPEMWHAGAEGSMARVMMWNIRPVGALVCTVFYGLAWLIVIRLPGSIARTKQWLAARASTSTPSAV